jgi:hypothetical protein
VRPIRRRTQTFGSLWPGKHGKRGIYGKCGKSGVRPIQRRIRTFDSLWPGKHDYRGIYGKVVKWLNVVNEVKMRT